MLIFNSKKRDFYTNRLTFYQQQISAQQQQQKKSKSHIQSSRHILTTVEDMADM